MTDQTYMANSDGSISITDADGKATRYVKESDLLAVKGGSEQAKTSFENQVATLQAQIADTNTKLNETKQLLLQETAAKEKAVGQLPEFDTLKTRVGELTTELKTANEKLTASEASVTAGLQNTLITTYRLDPKKVKAMTPEKLREVESNFRETGFTPVTSGTTPVYDGAGGAGGNEGKKDETTRLQERYPTMKVA